VGKLKPDWMKTDIPKETKIKLWRAMKDNPTHKSWQQSIAKNSKLFTEDEDEYVRTSYETYTALKNEVEEMPLNEVLSLSQDLQDWIVEIRSELKEEIDNKNKQEKPENWIEAHKAKTDEYPPLSKSLAKTVQNYTPGEPVHKGLIPTAVTWGQVLRLQRTPNLYKKWQELVTWLGYDSDELEQQAYAQAPPVGRKSTGLIHKRKTS